MPKYLWIASYTGEGAKGVIKEGGSGRRDAVTKLVEGLGGKVEAFYFALGESDAYVVTDMPDNEAVAAGSLAVNAVGTVQVRTVVLLTPEEVDRAAAAQRSVDYRPPGA